MRVWEQSPRVHDCAVCEGMCSMATANRSLARLPAARPPAHHAPREEEEEDHRRIRAAPIEGKRILASTPRLLSRLGSGFDAHVV